MTGEMFKHDVTREAFPTHFAIADALGGTVEPFDVYQGPYILIGKDIRAGAEPYAVALRSFGVVRLWISSDDGALATVYNEANGQQSEPFFWGQPWTEAEAINAARSIL